MAECVQCGYCCTVAPCGFGEWDADKKQCKYLTEDNLCDKYDEIEADPSSDISPAFGAGCSSSLGNTRREQKIKESQELRGSNKTTVDRIMQKYDNYLDTFYDDSEPVKKEKPAPKVRKKSKKPKYGPGKCIHPGCGKGFEKKSGVQVYCPEHRFKKDRRNGS